MEIDAELRRQIVVAVLAGIVFLTGVVGIGLSYNGGNGLPEEGAIAVVGLLVGFILLMAAIGFYLSSKGE